MSLLKVHPRLRSMVSPIGFFIRSQTQINKLKFIRTHKPLIIRSYTSIQKKKVVGKIVLLTEHSITLTLCIALIRFQAEEIINKSWNTLKSIANNQSQKVSFN